MEDPLTKFIIILLLYILLLCKFIFIFISLHKELFLWSYPNHKYAKVLHSSRAGRLPYCRMWYTKSSCMWTFFLENLNNSTYIEVWRWSTIQCEYIGKFQRGTSKLFYVIFGHKIYHLGKSWPNVYYNWVLVRSECIKYEGNEIVSRIQEAKKPMGLGI